MPLGEVRGDADCKRQLAVEIENLEARLKMIEVAQTTSEFILTTASWLARVI